MRVKTLTPTRSLNPAYRKEKVRREDIDRLKRELPLLLDTSGARLPRSWGEFKGWFLDPSPTEARRASS